MAKKEAQKKGNDRELARIKYVYRGMSAVEIADDLAVSRQSVHNWIRSGKWNDLKAEMAMTPEEEIKEIRALINQKLDDIRNRPEGKEKRSAGDLDGLRKLYKSLKEAKGGASVADMISFGERFVTYMRPLDPEFTKLFVKYYDAFINDNL